ncbi:TonB-dependent copper receptor [Thauera sp. CAU 1555]|uniref:TonB-dependent copper receptor n=1 Tax=Thauera sedimentorum TaxID=2767595 RepID=A0ABR9B730_9RHOO|nr:TonB-dependent copper receptor [Thauera sedimentorum]MBC9071082.1 TonB-dependent copper receptor [Thauera sedimentorum]MBD8502001.1 TonB-dependent copper receptor [Thauera sedimentorum]
MQHRQTRLTAALIALPFALPVAAAEETTLAPQVVTAAPMSEPLTVVTDPRAPRQPIPALDGADILKTIPGFSVIRKGGTSGDPVFRGMAGSRLNILLDGENILGGCGGRMDPPTAYVFPESYDRMTVLKGPQTVIHGPGNSAGTVLFERSRERASEAGGAVDASITAGSFQRLDLMGEGRYATPDFYLRGTATRTRADDYEDGDGNDVHSAYKRWSGTVALGWTPDDDTVLELTYARSDGEAAYADRTMDGTVFDRENVGLRFEKRKLSPVVEKLEALVYRNYIDHVMDNFSLRDGTMPGMRMVSNPDRLTRGARVAADLRLAEPTLLTVGVDGQSNDHTLRSAMGVNAEDAYQDKARSTDATFRNHGVFGELRHELGDQDRLIGGLRVDRWRAKDHRRGAIVTAGQRRSDTLTSGFARWEHDLADGATTAYAGLGRSERFPDYWELISQNKQSLTTNSAFLTKPEQTTQLDLGINWDAGTVSGSVSAFYADIDDYILIDKVTKGGGVTTVRNIDARSYGLEAGLAWRFARNWQTDASLAWVHGRNRTDDTALAQQPPLEARFGLNWDNGTWSAGALWRLVAAQNRVDPGKGNIAGQDVGETSGFGVFSINGGYRMNKRVKITAGIDNLFDKKYAEHLSKSGAAITGYEADTRVNEPGRTLWVKASLALD